MRSSFFAAAFLLVFIFGIQNVDTRYVPSLKRIQSDELSNDAKYASHSNDASMPDIYRRNLFKQSSMPVKLEHHRYHRDLNMGIDPHKHYGPNFAYGPHTFTGQVQCSSEKYGVHGPNFMFPTVTVMRRNSIGYTEAIGSTIIRGFDGKYSVDGIVEEGTFKTVELYLVFQCVCTKGDSLELRNADPDEYTVSTFECTDEDVIMKDGKQIYKLYE